MRETPRSCGWIEVIAGSMYSGKSAELIRRLDRVGYAGKRAIVFRPRIDTRHQEASIRSRSGTELEALIVDRSADMLEVGLGYDVIGVDEAQFFDPDLVDVCRLLADAGKRVIVAGLDLDYRRVPFGPMPLLLAESEFTDKLQAICTVCGGPGTLTQRIVDGKPAPHGQDVIVVGDVESYESRCRGCYREG